MKTIKQFVGYLNVSGRYYVEEKGNERDFLLLSKVVESPTVGLIPPQTFWFQLHFCFLCSFSTSENKTKDLLLFWM